MNNILMLALLSYKERYSSLSGWQFLLLKILQPTVQVLFFVLLINYSGRNINLSVAVIENSLLSACVYSSIYSAYTLNNERVLGTLKFTVVSGNSSTFRTILIRSVSSLPDGLSMVFIPIILSRILLGISFTGKAIFVTLLGFFLGSFGAIAVSLLIGCISIVSTDLNLFVNLLMFLLNFFSGAIFPISDLPVLFSKIANFIPLNNTISLVDRLLRGGTFFSSESLVFVVRELVIGLVLIIVTRLSYKYFERKAVVDGSLDFY